MAPKKTDAELAAEIELEQRVMHLKLMEGRSFAYIAEALELGHKMDAKRIFDKGRLKLVKEQASKNYEIWRAGEIHYWETHVGEAWQAWQDSKGEKEKVTEVSGYDIKRGSFSQTTRQTWVDVGSPQFLQAAKEGKAELYRLLGITDIAKAGGTGSAGQGQGGKTELVIKQRVYIPGYGDVTSENMEQLWRDLEAKYDSAAD